MLARSFCYTLSFVLLAMTSASSVASPSQMSVDVPCPANVQMRVGEKRYMTAYENPSTGYTWSVHQSHTLFKISDHRQQPMTHFAVVGAGEQRTWIFQAIKAGRTTLSLTHGRSWEKQPIQTWQCEIDVLEAAAA